MPSRNFIGLIYSCDLDNPSDLLGDKKKRIGGAERIDTLTVKRLPVKCKKITNHFIFCLDKDILIMFGMLN